MKKLLCLLLVITMIFVLISCGGTNGNEGSNADSEQTYEFLMGTGNVGGTWYPVGGAFAAAMSMAENVTITPQTAAGSTETIRMMAAGERELGLLSTNMITWAEQGIEFFDGEEPVDCIRSIATCMPQAFHYVVRAGSGINDLTDLKSKRVGTGAPGSGEAIFAPAMIIMAGVDEGDFVQEMLSYTEQITAFKDRQLDSMFLNTPPPSSAVMDVASQADIKLVGFSDELIDKIIKTAPYYYKDTIKKDAYDFMTEDINTVGVMSCLTCHKDLPEDVVYEMTKALFENVDTIRSTHASVADFSIETALVGNSCKVHPGAIRYYEEMGIEVPDEFKE